MRHATEPINFASTESSTPHGSGPRAIRWRGFAGNDAVCDDHPVSAGDTATADAASLRPLSVELGRAARARRAAYIGDLVAAALQAVTARVRDALARLDQRRLERNTYQALRELDDHTLRDLGFDRSELTSVAAEVARTAENTRVRTLFSSHPQL